MRADYDAALAVRQDRVVAEDNGSSRGVDVILLRPTWPRTRARSVVCRNRSGDPEGLGVLPLESESQTRSVIGGAQDTLMRLEHAVEKEVVGTHVVVEVLDMSQVRWHRCRVYVDRGAAVRGKRSLVSRAGCSYAEPLCDAGATANVRLQDVNRPAREHRAEVFEVISVFSSGDFERKRVTQCSQAVEIIGRHGLFEPRDTEFLCVKIPQPQRMLPAIGAVGINEQLRIVADRLPRRPNAAEVCLPRGAPILADLHLDARDALFHPPGQLGAQITLCVRRKAAASVDGNGVADRAEEAVERQVERAGFRIPQS